MKRVDSVISLIYSLSKSEKKHFSLQVIKDKEEKDYLVIYDIIIKSKQPNGNTVKEEFYRRKPNGSFEVSIQYLYEKLTDTLLTLRKRKISITICWIICAKPECFMNVLCLKSVSKYYPIQ